MYVLLVSCSEKLGTDWVNCSEEYLPDDIGLLYLPDITQGYFAEAFTAFIYIFCSEIRPPRMSRQKGSRFAGVYSTSVSELSWSFYLFLSRPAHPVLAFTNNDDQ